MADAAGCLGEIASAEGTRLEQLEHVGVEGWSGGFHQVEGEGVSVAIVGMDDAKARVESESETREAGRL